MAPKGTGASNAPSNENQNRKPWGDAKAVIPTGKKDADKWIYLAPVWESDSGALSFELAVEPVGWRNPNVERRIVIVRRQDGAK